MQMLKAGGVPCYYDHPQSLESEAVLRLPEDVSWVAECQGKAVKVLDRNALALPEGYRYRFIWVNRVASHIAQSQAMMAFALMGLRLERAEQAVLAGSLLRDKGRIIRRLKEYPDSDLIEVRFTDLLEAPLTQAARLATHLDLGGLDVQAMASTVIPRPPEPQGMAIEAQLLAQGE